MAWLLAFLGRFLLGERVLRGLHCGRLLPFLVGLPVWLALAAPAQAASPLVMVGAAEDASETSDPGLAKAKMDLAVLAGFNTIRVTALWTPGKTWVSGWDEEALLNAATAAEL